jgi:hypothetical protein
MEPPARGYRATPRGGRAGQGHEVGLFVAHGGPALGPARASVRYFPRCGQFFFVQVAYSASAWSCSSKPRVCATLR